MAPTETTGRLIRAQELSSIVPYSLQQIRRLEAVDKFPRRVRIGANRVGWVREEVELWLAARWGSADHDK